MTSGYGDYVMQCLIGPLYHVTTLNLFEVVCCCASITLHAICQPAQFAKCVYVRVGLIERIITITLC